MNRREWYEEDYDPSPSRRELVFFGWTSAEFSKVLQTTARQNGKSIAVFIDVNEKVTPVLKALGKQIQAMGKAIFPQENHSAFDLRVPIKAHSMTPRKNTVYDHRGRKRY